MGSPRAPIHQNQNAKYSVSVGSMISLATVPAVGAVASVGMRLDVTADKPNPPQCGFPARRGKDRHVLEERVNGGPFCGRRR